MPNTIAKAAIIFLLGGLFFNCVSDDSTASAASLQLSWVDQASDEAGFNIERKLGLNGTYAQIATVSANVTSYFDSALADSTTYCYRVRAFNSAGSSPYTPDVCGTTPAPPPINSYNLTVSLLGSGTVTSTPTGINCTTSCVKSYISATVVALVATPAVGYSFSSWSGDPDCADGSVTLNANKSCTATFTANPVTSTSYALTVSAVGTITGAGTGSGKVLSTPAGIDCGTKCSATFTSASKITLQPIPATGSMFTGWSGDPDCLDGSVTMSGNKSCAAAFKLISSGLTVSLQGTGSGKVISNPAGINCGSLCFAEYAKDAIVKLTATAAADSAFSGWSGDADCVDGSLTMNSAKGCIAKFAKRAVANIGVFRPSTGDWFLIANSTGKWQGCEVDHCIAEFGNQGDRPVAGDWNGTGIANIGIYDPSKKIWELDANSSSSWQGCSTDSCASFSVSTVIGGEIPITGRWAGASKDTPGLFQFVQTKTTNRIRRSTTNTNIAGYWYLDKNGNSKFDGCSIDLCFGPFGQQGDVPVAGDWDATGVTKIGVFTAKTGIWTLDANNNGKVDGCTIDKCFGPFGSIGDIPVAGDWTGSGTAKIGVFRAATGEWFLDLNGNGKWDGCEVDRCVTTFGQTGDLPVVGKW